MGPPSPSSALPPRVNTRRSTSIDFAENQLFPSLIGLSPLATAHPRLFQQAWVRSSSACYRTFNLAMARSLGFGSSAATERPVQTRFRYAFAYRLKLAANGNSLTHYTKGTPSPHQRLRLLVGVRFQVYFTPLSGCFSPFPHGTCSLSVTREYLGLEGGPPMFRQDFTCPALLKDQTVFTHTGLSPAMAGLSRPFCLSQLDHWPVPRSLATTSGISVDVFSSGY